jgi:hypothetical protein
MYLPSRYLVMTESLVKIKSAEPSCILQIKHWYFFIFLFFIENVHCAWICYLNMSILSACVLLCILFDTIYLSSSEQLTKLLIASLCRSVAIIQLPIQHLLSGVWVWSHSCFSYQSSRFLLNCYPKSTTTIWVGKFTCAPFFPMQWKWQLKYWNQNHLWTKTYVIIVLSII